MGKSNQVEKKKLQLDGEDLNDLINLGEYPIETGTTSIPGQDKEVPVSNGVVKIPEVDATFKILRNSKTMKKLEDFFRKKQVFDMVCIVTDGSGNEIRRELWTNVECSKFNGPGYDASSPVAAQILTKFLPEDIIPIQV